MISSRAVLTITGLFMLGLAYTTYWNNTLDDLPTHGPLVLISLVGGFLGLISGVFGVKLYRVETRLMTFALLISYSLIRAGNFLFLAIQKEQSFIDVLQQISPVFIWLFIAYIAYVKYRLRIYFPEKKESHEKFTVGPLNVIPKIKQQVAKLHNTKED